jgi:rhodanese-related sulfurtransferase
VAGKLIEMGFKDVSALKGGWKLWWRMGYPTELK